MSAAAAGRGSRARAAGAAPSGATAAGPRAGLTIGLLTIGQSPRPDGLASDVATVLGGGVLGDGVLGGGVFGNGVLGNGVLGNARVLERGALDDAGDHDIAAMRPGEGDYRLVTLLRDGRSVEVAKRHLLPRLQAQIDALEEDGADVTLLMCTGEFPSFRHRRPLLAPQAALYAVVTALAAGGRVASLTPLESQVEQARRKWASLGVADAFVTHADPYGAEPLREVAAGAARAAEAGAGVCFLDCFGYDLRMRDAAREAFPGQVVLARSLAARLAAEVAP
jgi:protein AroM